jgi:hypothetical protein
MTVLLPNNYTIITAQGSQWSAVYTIYNDDGSLANISLKVFEFVVRDRLDAAGGVLFSFSSVVSNAYGSMTVSTEDSTVQVVVNPAATSLLSEGGGPYTLWMDQDLPDATALVTGIFLAQIIAAP